MGVAFQAITPYRLPAVISGRQLVGGGQVRISLDAVFSIKVLSGAAVSWSGMSL